MEDGKRRRPLKLRLPGGPVLIIHEFTSSSPLVLTPLSLPGGPNLKARRDASQTGAEAPAAGAGVLVTYVKPAGRGLRVPYRSMYRPRRLSENHAKEESENPSATRSAPP